MPEPASLRVWIQRLRGGGIGAVLARGASLFLLVNVAGTAVSFGLHVLLARRLGVEPYGTYVYVHSWMLLLLVLCRAGMGTASLRYVAAFCAQQDWPSLRGFLRTGHVVVATASVVVATATALSVLGLGERLPDALRGTFLVACLTLPVYAFLQLWSHVLRGFKRVLASQLPASLFQPALLAVLVLLAVQLRSDALDAAQAMGLTLASGAAAAAIAWRSLRHSIPAQVRTAPARSEARAWLAVAAPLLVYNALLVLHERTDVVLVGSLLGSAETGVYAAASRVANVIAFGLTAMNAWAAPLIADLHARGDREGLQRLVRLAARGIFAFTLPVAVAVVLFAEPVLGVFGGEFVRARTALVILVLSQVVNALVGPVGFLMTMTGRQTLAAWILGAHAALLFGLNLLLIPRYGIEGAAAATGVTRASWNVVMALAVWRTLRLRATIL